MVNVKSLLLFAFAASAIAAPLEPIENLNATVGTPEQLDAANDVVSISKNRIQCKIRLTTVRSDILLPQIHRRSKDQQQRCPDRRNLQDQGHGKRKMGRRGRRQNGERIPEAVLQQRGVALREAVQHEGPRHLRVPHPEGPEDQLPQGLQEGERQPGSDPGVLRPALQLLRDWHQAE